MERDRYKLEPEDHCENDTDENDEKLPTRWELLIRNGDIPWGCEIRDTAENGNCFASVTFWSRSKRKEAS